MSERTIDIGMRKIREALEETESALQIGFENADRARADDRSELQQFREREACVQRLLSTWPHFTSQEMYGEMLRDGMSVEDFEAWEQAFDCVRNFKSENKANRPAGGPSGLV